MGKTCIVGFGNLLMSDDGAGIRVIQRLERCLLPDSVEVIDGGVSSFAVLCQIQDAERVIIVDAVKGEGIPGEIYRLSEKDLASGGTAGDVLSLHELSLLDTLHQLRVMGQFPPVTVFGIQPETVHPGLQLTALVETAVNKLVAIILREVQEN